MGYDTVIEFECNKGGVRRWRWRRRRGEKEGEEERGGEGGEQIWGE